MKVTRERGCRHTDFLIFEVVTAGEIDVKTVTEADVATEVPVLRESLEITHRLIVEVTTTFTHRDTIGDAERPR